MEPDEEVSARQQTPALSEATDLETSSQAHGVDTLDQLHQSETNRSKRRVATVYDAVAGMPSTNNQSCRESHH